MSTKYCLFQNDLRGTLYGTQQVSQSGTAVDIKSNHKQLGPD
jgi:hypothetical protein